MGIYLSAHPLDDYAVVLKHMCNLNCSQIGREMDKKAFASIEELTFGGIVTSVSQRWTKTNKPFGIVTIEDFEGQGELALFGEEWTKWQSMLHEEYHVYITAQCVQRFRNNPDAYDMVIKKIEFLSDVKEKSIEKFTVYMEASMFNDAQLTDLEDNAQELRRQGAALHQHPRRQEQHQHTALQPQHNGRREQETAHLARRNGRIGRTLWHQLTIINRLAQTLIYNHYL